MINGKKKGGPQQQNQLKNSQKRQTVIVKNNKSVQDLKLKMEKTNQKKKSLKNVSNKASKPKSKTTLEKQIALNKHQTGLKKIKSKSGMFLTSSRFENTNIKMHMYALAKNNFRHELPTELQNYKD